MIDLALRRPGRFDREIVVPVPNAEGGAVERMAVQFFYELDHISDLSEVIVLGATNREDLLDPALLRAGRLDFVLRFPVPDEKGRLEIFQVHTKGKPLESGVDMTELAKSTEGMVGSHIALICKRATMMAIADLIHGPREEGFKKLLVTAAHFQTAIKEVQ